jgi:hypothetical protein
MVSRLLACQVNNGGQSIFEILHLPRANVELPNASMHGAEFRLLKKGGGPFPKEPPPSTTFCKATLHRVAINAMVRISNYSCVVQPLSAAAEHRPRNAEPVVS